MVAVIICLLYCSTIIPQKFALSSLFSPCLSNILEPLRSACSANHANSHHLCTDAAALSTAVSEVAFLVQNRLSLYITFHRLYLAYRGLSRKIHFPSTNISPFFIPLHHWSRVVGRLSSPQTIALRCIRDHGPPVGDNRSMLVAVMDREIKW